MYSCVTISLVAEARGGPFVFWDGLQDGCRQAADLGFSAVEVFPPSADQLPTAELRRLLDTHRLQLAAVGTGAGWLRHQLTLTAPEPDVRRRAELFIRDLVDAAGGFGASAIIGSMQGRWQGEVDRQQALELLAGSLGRLGAHAQQYGVPLFYEPLNRYETNLCNTLDDGVALLQEHHVANVTLLADLFHMNIEESDLAGAIRRAGSYIGHVHFVDSNRQAAGRGHLNFQPIAGALREIGFQGALSAEALPIPDPVTSAAETVAAFRKYIDCSQ